MMSRKLAISFFFSLFALVSFSQNKNNPAYKFEHLTMEDGLSSNAVVCFYRDANGFMWMGTENGLNRYDGNYVKVYKHDSLNANSLAGNFVTNITVDDKGKLWVSCFDKGISVFDPVTEKFKNYSHHEQIDDVLIIGIRM